MSPDESAVPLETLLAEAAWLRTLAQGLVRDPGAAEDVVQETWLAALKSPPLSGRPLRPWLRAVAQNVVRMRGRGDVARRQREEVRAKEEAQASDVELVDRVEEQRFLAREVLKLDEPFRTTVVLRYYEGLTSEQIAVRTNSNENTARWRLKRGLEQLRERLDRRHGGDRREWMALLAPLCAPTAAPSSVAAAPVSASSSPLLGIALSLGALGIVLTAFAWWIARPAPSSPHLAAVASVEVPVTTPGAPDGSPQRAPTAALRVEETAQRAPARLRGRSVDSSGAPAPGALVSVVSGDGVTLAETSAAPDGAFEFAVELGRGVGRSVDLSVEAAGFLEARLHTPLGAGETFDVGDVPLTREARVAGLVLDASWRAIAGAEVLVEPIGSRWASVREAPLEEARRLGSLLGPDAPRARCADDGRFEIKGLAEGFVRLWVRAEGFETQWTEPVALFAGELADASTLTLAPLDEARCVWGRVVDEAGAPVAGAQLEAARSSLGRPFFSGRFGVVSAASDADGVFRIALETGASYDLAVHSARGVALALGLTPGLGETVVRLKARPSWDVIWSASEAPDEDDRVLELTARDASTGSLLATLYAPWRADARASFVVEAWRPFVIEAKSKQWSGRSESIDPAAPPAPVLLGLERMVKRSVRVLAQGRPVLGAEVEVLAARQDPRPWSEPVLFGDPLRLVVDDPERVESSLPVDSNGVAIVRAPRGARIALRVRAPEFASALLGPFRVDEGESVVELSAGGTLEGVVRRLDGAFVEATCVAVSRGDGLVQRQFAGPDGAYRFDALAAGAWQVRVVAPQAVELPPDSSAGAERTGKLRDDVSITAGESTRFDLEVGAPPRCSLAGELTLDGLAPGAWVVEIARPGKPRVLARAFLDPRGRFALGVEAAGEYELRIDSVGRGGVRYELRERVNLVEGSTRFAWAERSATVRPCAPWAAGDARARVACATSAGGTLVVSAALDATGCVELTTLASDLLVELDDGSAAPSTLRLRTAERREVLLERR